MLHLCDTHTHVYINHGFFPHSFFNWDWCIFEGFFTLVFSSTVIVQIAYLVFEVAEMSSTNIYLIKARLYKMLGADFGSNM